MNIINSRIIYTIYILYILYIYYNIYYIYTIIDFLPELNRFLKFVADSQFKDVVLMSDFNYPNIQWSDGSGFSTIGSEIGFIDLITDFSYLQLINSSARGHNIIDLVLTTNEHLTDNY